MLLYNLFGFEFQPFIALNNTNGKRPSNNGNAKQNRTEVNDSETKQYVAVVLHELLSGLNFIFFR
jgi:hypothetical protein